METATEQEREALAIISRAGTISSAARVDKTIIYAFEWTGFGVAFLLCSGQIALRLAFSRCLRVEDGLTLLALVFLLVLAIIVTLEVDPLYELLGLLSGESSLAIQLSETPKQSARLSSATDAANLISWSCVCTVKTCSLVCFWRAVRPMKIMVQRLWIHFWAIVAFTVISYGVGMVIFPLLRSHGPNTFSGLSSFPVALFLKIQLVLRQIFASCAVFGLALCAVAVAVVQYIMFRASCNRPQLLLSSTLF
ncbi:hypothetical protein ASPWEDRAFT_306159 [Aspergillus wentii DTO 134E9]|uniref:Uncharacterized protein n=1 Tax=Aspergillus wentii DTO 134E9 TaxID=1073089 RepID=A0A1L9R3R2_ASPWE|nr:uncharacterized protein ASPWEDRAFT_306159 [Aspergillus wentii DTO 134E9]OJJ29556.1 hypothetical protein ASPWEDRAFT_306159 [Aspergillus wentii DTO 134E9]